MSQFPKTPEKMWEEKLRQNKGRVQMAKELNYNKAL